MKSWQVALLVAGILMAACCGGVFVCGRQTLLSAASAQSEAKVYGQQVLRDIGQDWGLEQTWSHTSPLAKRRLTKEDYDKVLVTFRRRLGPIKTIGPLTASNVNFASSSGTGSYTIVRARTEVEFEKAKGTITLHLVKYEGRWWLNGININSPVFLE